LGQCDHYSEVSTGVTMLFKTV